MADVAKTGFLAEVEADVGRIVVGDALDNQSITKTLDLYYMNLFRSFKAPHHSRFGEFVRMLTKRLVGEVGAKQAVAIQRTNLPAAHAAPSTARR